MGFIRTSLRRAYLSQFLSGRDFTQNLRLVDGFVRHVLVLLTGTMIAQIIPVLATPVLTRLYTPHDFGVFALLASLVSIISISITGNYDGAVMLPKKDRDALHLVAVCVVICLAASALVFMGLWLFNHQVTRFLGNPDISVWLYLVPLIVFVTGLHQTLTYWASRRRQFGSLAVNKVAQSVVTPGVNVIMGFAVQGAVGLVVGFTCGKIVATWMLWRRLWREKVEGRNTIQRAVMAEQAKRYLDFPLYAAPTSFLDVAALEAPVLFLTKFFGAGVVGLFALASRAIASPLTLIGASIGQVYHQRIAEARHRNADLTPYVFKVAGYLALIACVPLLIVVFFSPSLFAFVFGEQWRVAGDYARILVFPVAVKFVVSPLSTMMAVSGNVRLGSAWKIVYFFTTFVTLYVASHFDLKTFFYIYSVHEMVLYAFYFFLICRSSTNLQVSVE